MNKVVLDTLKSVAKQNNIKIDFNKLDTTLKDSGVDSLALLNLVFKVENELNVQLDNSKLVTIKNLGDLINAFDEAYSKKIKI